MKYKYLILSIGFLMGIFVIRGLIAQGSAPTVEIKLDFVSNHKISENPSLSATGRASGLNNVGVGETVYLLSMTDGTNPTYDWSIEGPANSTVTLSNTDRDSTYFQPDTNGIYTVILTVTATEGTATDSIKVNAGTYLSVGTVDGVEALFPTCGTGCHQDQHDAWLETHHSSAFKGKIDGTYFSEGCVQCHVLGYNDIATAVNDGFDDIATELGWTFPETVGPGNFQDMIDNYLPLAQRASIQCENCHGPGSEHIFNFKRGPIEESHIGISYEAGLCAYCHDAPTHHVYYPEWEKSGHGPEGYHPNRTSCAKCHTGKGFVLETVRGKASGAPYDEGVAITCQSCHDPHDATNAHQIRKVSDVTLGNDYVVTKGGKGKLCMNCHISRRNAEEYVTEYHSHFGPHHSAQTDMFVGSNAIEFGLSMPRTGHVNAITNSCVTCHMNEPEDESLIDQTTHIAKVGQHTWSMVYATATDTLHNIEPCQECHGSSIEKFDDIAAAADYDGDGTIEGAVTEIEGLMHQLGMILPPIGESEVTVVSDYTPVQLKAAYNYLFVEEDHSHGIHNTSYAVAILKAAINAVTTGDIGAGSIISITDVPNDQGKQVRVKWNRFPGDGTSENPISQYGVWRRIDDMSLAKNANTVSSYEDMFNTIENASEGGQYIVSETGELWDFVKAAPASGESQYSTVSPTLFDSTIVSGIHWSVFYVSGHAKDGGLVVKTAVDSGYSVDNLAPSVPLPKSAVKSGETVTIEWSDVEDADFNYFKLYRGTVDEFDPTYTQPIAQMVNTVYTDNLSTTGEKYYYKITAVDYNGNESGFSWQISEDNIITGVDDNTNIALPNTFMLDQNYPNPFNPTTRIRYQLPRSVNISLTIYNILGKRIATLVNGVEYAGYHEIEWDGKDESGNTVSSGIYIYRIQAGNFSESRKMILMK